MPRAAAARLVALLALILAGASASILPLFFSGERLKSKAEFYTECAQNIKRLSSEIELYAVENDQVFPRQLSDLISERLPSIPKCPSAGFPTYGFSHSAGDYLIYCAGRWHPEHGPNMPRLSTRESPSVVR